LGFDGKLAISGNEKPNIKLLIAIDKNEAIEKPAKHKINNQINCRVGPASIKLGGNS
jgi:hypothetical protein